MANETGTVPSAAKDGNADKRLVTALFDSLTRAEAAVDCLADEGVPKSDIRLTPANEWDRDGSETPATTLSIEAQGTGFWDALKELFFPSEDRHVYAEGLSRGGF